METFVAWIQDNHLPLLGLQLAIVLTVGLWILLRRLRQSAEATEMDEPAEGDRRTVVLPEEDAAQMFETLTALQEELERYRKPGHAAVEQPVVEDLTAPVRESETWDEEIRAHAITEKTPVEDLIEERDERMEDATERPESKPVDQVSPADRVLRNWLEDVEQLARRARRDSL